MPRCSIVAFVLCIDVNTDVDDTSLDITRLCRFPGNKWSSMSIHSYFTVKKHDVHKGELDKVVPASTAESVKSELQRTAGVKHTTNGEGGSTERKRSAYERSLWNIEVATLLKTE